MINQPVLITAHLEKIVRFFDRFRFGFMIRTFAVNQFTFRIETLAPKTVKAFIFTEIDIAGIINLLHYLFNNRNMGCIGSTDKTIVFDIKFRPERLKEPAYLIHIVPGA